MPVKEVTSCLGYQQITSLSSSTGLTIPTTTDKPSCALIIAESDPVRWRDDGTAPTSATGMPLATGEQFFYDGDLTKIRFIEQTSGAILNVSYYK